LSCLEELKNPSPEVIIKKDQEIKENQKEGAEGGDTDAVNTLKSIPEIPPEDITSEALIQEVEKKSIPPSTNENEIEWPELEIIRRIELFFGLCTKNQALLIESVIFFFLFFPFSFNVCYFVFG